MDIVSNEASPPRQPIQQRQPSQPSQQRQPSRKRLNMATKKKTTTQNSRVSKKRKPIVESDSSAEDSDTSLDGFIAPEGEIEIAQESEPEWPEWPAQEQKEHKARDLKDEKFGSTELDVVQYSDCRSRVTIDGVAFYDRDGTLLNEKSPRKIVEKTCFIAPGNGSVVYLGNRDLGLFYCTESDGRTVHAPGKIVGWFIDPDDLEVTLEIQWMWNNEALCERYKPSTITNVDACFAAQTDAFELTSYRGQLMHYARNTRERVMMDYINAYNEYTRLENGPLLRHWTSDQIHLGIVEEDVIDMADLLELYYIPAHLIWRSRLGRFVWKTFLTHVVDFGRGPNMPLVKELLSTDEWHDEKVVGDFLNCDACKKREVGFKKVIFDDGKEGTFGSTCIKRMKYIHSIGAQIRAFRCELFDANFVHTFISTLHKTHAVYHANR